MPVNKSAPIDWQGSEPIGRGEATTWQATRDSPSRIGGAHRPAHAAPKDIAPMLDKKGGGVVRPRAARGRTLAGVLAPMSSDPPRIALIGEGAAPNT